MNQDTYKNLLENDSYDEIIKRLLNICIYLKKGSLLHFEDYQVLRGKYQYEELAKLIYKLLFDEEHLLEIRINQLVIFIQEYAGHAKLFALDWMYTTLK